MDGAHNISTESINIPDERFRPINKVKRDEIAQSILIFGQLQPIIVQPIDDGSGYLFDLVDGLHRLSAMMENGKPTIGAVYQHDIDDVLAREIELEANIQRVEMTWQEHVYAVVELDEMKTVRDPTWTQRKTAEMLGRSQPNVARMVNLKKMMDTFPEIAEAKTPTQALSWAKHKAKTFMRAVDVMDKKDTKEYKPVTERIVLGDAVEVIKTVPDESFDLILTDPPFGINYDQRKTGLIGSVNAYQDTPDLYYNLLSMAPDLYRVIKKDGWMVWFLGPSWYERAKEAFRKAGFTVDEMPIIWDRSDGPCYTTRPDKYFSRAYDMALHCIKGSPEMVLRGQKNVIHEAPVSNKERDLLAERPVELYVELIRRMTLEGEVVADFFAGSGSCLAAANMMKRDYFGCEIDPERYAAAVKKVQAYSTSVFEPANQE